MKHFLTALMSFIAFSAFAQIEVTTNGSVGIGTDSPNALLDVNGDSYFSGLATFNRGTEFSAEFNRGFTDKIASGFAHYFGIGNAHILGRSMILERSLWFSPEAPSSTTHSYYLKNTNNQLRFARALAGATQNSELLVLDSNNHIGIGTIDPKERLHVEGDFLIDAFGTGNESGIFFRENFTNSNKYNLSILAYDHNGASSDGLSINGFDGISFSTGANTRNERMRIDQNGNVGIGLTTPSEKLEIFDSTTTPSVLSLRSSRNDSINVDVGRVVGKNSGQEVSRIGLSRAGGTWTGFLTFWTKETNTSALSEKMRITAAGNVGIGTTDTFGYRLAVDGTIGSDEMFVHDTVNFPDYVFESDYQLLSLTQVEEHIKEKGHLPNIPSAKEIEEKGGFSLGEMNKKLLEKVEELMLYTIQQEKRIKALEKELKKLKQ